MELFGRILVLLLLFSLFFFLLRKRKSTLRGRWEIVVPGDIDYEEKRQNYNRRNSKYPAAIVYPKNASEVQRVEKMLRTKPFCVRSGGHSYENFSVCDGVVIDLSSLQKIQISSPGVFVGAGVEIDTLVRALSPSHRAIPTGTCPTVGIAGLTLGGGIGFLVREYGLTCDRLVQVQIVLPSGQLVEANAWNSYADLFWAIRGAGNGNFGIVTEFVFESIPIDRVSWFVRTWPRKQFRKLFALWQVWAPWVDSKLSTVFHYDAPETPIRIEGVYLGPRRELKKLLRVFSGGEERLYEGSYEASVRFFADTPGPPFFQAHSQFFTRDLPVSSLKKLEKGMNVRTETLGYIPGGIFPISFGLGVGALGGNLSKTGNIPSGIAEGISKERTEEATAFAYRNALYWIQYIIHWSSPEQEEACRKFLSGVAEKTVSYSAGSYVNAPDLGLEDYMKSYYGTHVEKLKEIKRKYDPENLFHYAQSIPSSGLIWEEEATITSLKIIFQKNNII